MNIVRPGNYVKLFKIGTVFVLMSLGGMAAAQAACPSPDTLKARSLDRHFVQEKYFSGMDQPLRSEGQMTAQGDEIVWHMLKPFDVKTTISQSGITQSVSGGEETPVAAASGRMAGSIAKSLAAVMRGEWTALKAVFDVERPASKDDGDWEVRLTPHDERLATIMGKITVRGCEDVSSVDFGSSQDNREHIEFSATGS